MDLILKPRPGGKERKACAYLSGMIWEEGVGSLTLILTALCSRERILGPLQGGVGQDSGPRRSLEKAAQQALCGRAAAARPLNVWQKEHCHSFWTG